MNTGGTRLLGDADDGVLNLLWRGHHQVRQLVDDTDDVRVRAYLALGACRRLVFAGDNLAVIVLDLAYASSLHIHVALLHLLHQPLQGCCGLLRLGNDGRDQVRNALVRGKFHHLRVHQDEANLLRGGAGKQRDQHGVHKSGLTGTGSTGDQQVRHLLNRERGVFAFDVLAQTDEHGIRGAGHAWRIKHLAQVHHFTIWVRNLNADGRLAGDGREQT